MNEQMKKFLKGTKPKTSKKESKESKKLDRPDVERVRFWELSDNETLCIKTPHGEVDVSCVDGKLTVASDVEVRRM